MQVLQNTTARPVGLQRPSQSTRNAARMSVTRTRAVAEKTLVTTKSDEVRDCKGDCRLVELASFVQERQRSGL